MIARRVLALCPTLVFVLSCGGREPSARAPAARTEQARAASARELLLAPHEGNEPSDRRIRSLQQRLTNSKIPAQDLERLGWAFVALARERDDPGGYQMALTAALAIEDLARDSAAALLLRGHVLHSLHRFTEAEQVARRLVAVRGIPFDHGLLGDVLADRGELDEAIATYQRMVDLRPDMHSYARAAHVRYLKGDVDGARSAMQLAVQAASPRNRETFAWAWSKRAQYELAAGALDAAHEAVERALAVAPESALALKTSAQVALAHGQHDEARVALERARVRTPHPETLWLLLDILTLLGRTNERDEVRAQLKKDGASEDPRALALYLGTIGDDLARAEQLARAELRERHDVYSFEALAWVESARGRHEEALSDARRSLAAGTDDARLYFHAGLIAERAGARALALAWLARARTRAWTLLPSQQALLAAYVPGP